MIIISGTEEDGLSETTTLRADTPVKNPPVTALLQHPTSLLMSIYFVRRTDNVLHLTCSRDLRLPSLTAKCAYAKLQRLLLHNNKVVSSCVSDDEEFVAVALADGHIWLFNRIDVCWVACISTQFSMEFSPRVAPLKMKVNNGEVSLLCLFRYLWSSQ